eukprot:TRINITY_DN2281_c0_g1_i1.p1 TRINITY_DN2281_c0_g1~~TRINITY_DN2281_c0_g1_i1.p1  ORF type:complete len:347 (+),score=83.78 TRINITY_DN2281_c0_g1_i1:51-1091(+)
MSEEEPERQLEVDEEGRVKFEGTLPSIDNGVSIWDNVIGTDLLEQLKKECKAAVVKRTTGSKQYSRGSTYWLSAAADPKSLLEEYIKKVFDFHTKDAKFDKSRSGAEWWALSLDGDSNVGWHWDKDYYLESEMNINVYPQIGTVTYLTDVGCGTAVLNSIAPFCATDSVSCKPTTAWCCFPKPSRHLAFDGRYLHGAAAGGKAASTATNRVTILINIWLNHEPVTADPFFDEDRKPSNAKTVPVEVAFNTTSTITEVTQLPGDKSSSFRAGKKRTASLQIHEGDQPADTFERCFKSYKGGAPIATLQEIITDDDSTTESDEEEEEEEESEEDAELSESDIKRRKVD